MEAVDLVVQDEVVPRNKKSRFSEFLALTLLNKSPFVTLKPGHECER